MSATSPQEHVIIHAYAEEAYLQYAMAAVRSRALCQVQDGQLPVQRRLLYDMWLMGLLTATKPVKSARVVGDVLGKFHPHGDTAAYDSMVRLAQDFTLRYPLVAGQGNFGSRDGDTPAAMRYTEARLAPIASLLLGELDQETVDFGPNYDGAFQEPALLPARLPFSLLNGFTGIAVGLASDGLPHNLVEVANATVALVKNPQASLDELLGHLPGPDFPDGGQLISSREEIRQVYASGRGMLRSRARWRKEDLARGHWRLVVYELPYRASTRRVMEQIATLTNPQPAKGKKTLSPQQATLKQASLALLERVTDESGKDEKIRLVIYPKPSTQSPEELMAFLQANTCLEDSTRVNMTVIGLDGRPVTKGLVELLQEWITFRFETVRRRTRYELNRAERRQHVLDGRKLVMLNVDAVIRVIREAEEPKVELQRVFALTEVQADDILEMRLRQLARLEGIKIDKELGALSKDIARLSVLLSDERALRRLIIRELESDRDTYGDARRTLLHPEERADRTGSGLATALANEPCTVVVSRHLWVRRFPGHGLDPSSLSFRDGDAAWMTLETQTGHPFVLLDNTGRAYSLKVAELPTGRGDGVPLTTLLTLPDGARGAWALSASPEQTFLFSGEQGFGFTAPLRALQSRTRSGKRFLTLMEGEIPCRPLALPEGASGYLAVGSSDSKITLFRIAEVLPRPAGGRGVMLMMLTEGERIAGLRYFEGDKFEAVGQVKGEACTIRLVGETFRKALSHRGRKGVFTPRKAVLCDDVT